MNEQRCKEIETRLQEIKTQLNAIRDTKVVAMDPTSFEDRLLDELDVLEFELGIGHFRKS